MTYRITVLLLLLNTLACGQVIGGTGSVAGTGSIQVANTPRVTTTSLPNGTQNTAYSQTLTETGGTGPFVWSVSSGILPVGLSLSSGGVISGTPTTVETAAFRATVTDANSLTDSASLSITVSPGAALTLAAQTLPQTSTGSAYGPITLLATGGATPYASCDFNGSTPPAGLNVAVTNGTTPGCVLSGTITASAATYNFSVKIHDNAAATATQSYSIVVTALSSCGPPHYLCSSTSKAAVGTLSASASYVFQPTDTVNTTRYDTTLNPVGTNCYTMLSDLTTFPNGVDNTAIGGVDGAQQFSLNGDFTGIVTNGTMNLFKLDLSGNCMQRIWPAAGAIPTNHIIPQTVFSTVTDTRFYSQSPRGFPATSIVQGDLDCPSGAAGCGGDPTHFTQTQIFDYSWCPHTPGVGAVPGNSTGWDLGGADEFFVTGFTWSAFGDTCTGQGCTHNAYIFRKSTHQCASIDVANHNIYNWCDPDANGHGSGGSNDHANCVGAPIFATYSTTCVPTATQDGAHNISTNALGDIIEVDLRCSNSTPIGIPLMWFSGTGVNVGTTVRFDLNNNLAQGHGKIGEFGTMNENNPNVYYTVFPPTNASWPNGNTLLIGPLSGYAACEMHSSWENTPGDDSWDGIITSAICDSSTYGLTLNSPYMNEFFGADALHPQSAVPRFGHSFSTGAANAPAANTPGAGRFGCVNAAHFVSQDGNWIIFGSPMLGNMGLDSTGKQRCQAFGMHIQ